VLGSAGGSATLRASDVCIHRATSATNGHGLFLLVRDGVFTLGTTGASPDGPVRLVPTCGQDFSVSATPTALTNRTGGMNTLYKRGEGTLVLANVAYTDLAGSALTNFAWQIGRGTQNSPASPFFDGAVREPVPIGDALRGNSNSLDGFNVKFSGGVIESRGVLNRSMGTGANQMQWANNGGGGFAAQGGPLTVNIGGASATLAWGGASFVSSANPLIFGSRTADDVVTLQNPLDLTALREIRVIDNRNSLADRAVLAGVLTGDSAVKGMLKSGDGVLELAAGVTSSFQALEVTNGTLLINGTLDSQSTVVNVYDGATLGGTGTIQRAVTIHDGGSLAPGDRAPGTLTVGDLSLPDGSTSVFDLGTVAASDKVVVNGNLALRGVLLVNSLAGFGPGEYPIIVYSGSLLANTASLGQVGAGTRAHLDTSLPHVIRVVVSGGGSLLKVE
jgi:hypothetical protein